MQITDAHANACGFRISKATHRFLAASFALVTALSSPAATWYLNKAAVGANNGTSPANAWTSVASMTLTNLASGDILLISGGDYSTEELPLFFPGRNNITYAFDPASTQTAVFRSCQFFQANGSTLDGLKGSAQMIKFVGLADINGVLQSSILVRETTGFTIRGCEMTHEGLAPGDGRPHHGIHISGTVSRGTITRNNIHHLITDGININNSSAPPPDGVYNWFTISDNRIFFTGDDGIQAGFGGLTIANNDIDQGASPLFPGSHPDGFQLNPDRGHVRLYGNIIKGYNQSIFIEFTTGPGNIEIYNNVITGVWPDPTGLRTSRALNYSARSSFSGTFLFANNVSFNLVSFFALNGGLSNATAATKIFENNVFLNCRLISADATEAMRLGPSNIYFNLPGIQYFDTNGNPTTIATNQLAGNSTFANPGFVSPATNDFTPAGVTSAVIDAGVSLSSFFTTDRAGVSRPQGTSWDSGAHELDQSSPAIVTQPPANVFAPLGGTANISVTARGQAPLNYTWKKNGTPLINGGGISGATSATLTITNAGAFDAGSYTVDVTNSVGPLISSGAALLTIGAGTAPTFTTQPPATQSVALGGTATISSAATGTPTPTIQWKKNGVNLVEGGRFSGTTSSTLMIINVATGDAGTYTASADNGVAPIAVSDGSVLTVTGAPPVITANPAGQTVLAGNVASFSVAASGTAPLTYQWQKNGVAITGATSVSYSIPAAQGSDAGSYSVTVSNSVGSATSATAVLAVIVTPPPTFNVQPQSATVVSGQSVSVSAGATGAATYTWQVSNDGGGTWSTVFNDGTFSGANTNTLTVSNAAPGLASLRFRIVAGNEGGAVTSSVISFNVLPPVLVSPVDVAVASTGALLVSDSGLEVIHSINTSGVASVLAGVRNLPGAIDGTGASALFRQPAGITIDGAGNLLVADSGNSLVRKATSSGVVTTIAGSETNKDHRDGTGPNAFFNTPSGIAFDAAGTAFVADTGNSVIRKVTPTGVVTTLAGSAGARGSTDGSGAAARFNEPVGIAVDAAGNVFVADRLNQTIRRITSAGVVTTIAGLPGVAGFTDGNAITQALFNRPTGVTVDSLGNLYVTDSGNSTIRKISAGGVVSTLAGVPTISGFKDGTGTDAWFNQPTGIRLAAGGALYVADTGNAAIRWVSPAGSVLTIALTAPTAPFPTVPPNLPVASTSSVIPDAPGLPTATPTIVLAPDLPLTTPTIPPPPTLPSTTPTVPPPPSSGTGGGSGGGGGGGGGAPSAWFFIGLSALIALRIARAAKW